MPGLAARHRHARVTQLAVTGRLPGHARSFEAEIQLEGNTAEAELMSSAADRGFYPYATATHPLRMFPHQHVFRPLAMFVHGLDLLCPAGGTACQVGPERRAADGRQRKLPVTAFRL